MPINLKLKHPAHSPPLPKQLTGILLLSVLVGGGFEPYLAELGDLNWKCQVFLVEYKYFT